MKNKTNNYQNNQNQNKNKSNSETKNSGSKNCGRRSESGYGKDSEYSIELYLYAPNRNRHGTDEDGLRHRSER